MPVTKENSCCCKLNQQPDSCSTDASLRSPLQLTKKTATTIPSLLLSVFIAFLDLWIDAKSAATLADVGNFHIEINGRDQSAVALGTIIEKSLYHLELK